MVVLEVAIGDDDASSPAHTRTPRRTPRAAAVPITPGGGAALSPLAAAAFSREWTSPAGRDTDESGARYGLARSPNKWSHEEQMFVRTPRGPRRASPRVWPPALAPTATGAATANEETALMLASILNSARANEPPRPMGEILARYQDEERVLPPSSHSANSPRLPSLSPAAKKRESPGARAADEGMMNATFASLSTGGGDGLWEAFQTDVMLALQRRIDPPPPPPPPAPPHKSSRGPRVRRRPQPTAPEPSDWPSKVCLALHEHMKKYQSRVQDVFQKWDTDGSGGIDAQEFHCALNDLGIPEALKMPEDITGIEVQNTFNLMDDDGNGVLTFKEINHHLRSGKFEITLAKNLQAGAVAVAGVGGNSVQPHRTRRKEEWEALERFKALDVGGGGAATLRDMMGFFLSEGYSEGFVKALVNILDEDGNGEVTADEFRAGVRSLKGSTLLMSMTDPVEPPSGESFADLRQPRLLKPFAGYTRAQTGTVIYRDTELSLGQKAPRKGATIPPPEFRAITLAQLRTVVEHIKRRSNEEAWADCNGNRLKPEDVTMYDTVAYVIKPATKKRRCSYVELVSKGPQKPQWLVCHGWGQPIMEILTCLEQHARDRALDPNTAAYWIAAFAYSQWSFECRVALDAEESPLHRALDLVDGTVAVVDKQGSHFFSRIWCIYEMGLSLARAEAELSQFIFDVYTPLRHALTGELVERTTEGQAGCYDFRPGRAKLLPNAKPPLEATEMRYAVGMTEGAVAADRDPGHAKAARERHFPIALFEFALSCKLQGANAAVDKDRVAILNSVAHAEALDAKPEPSHKNYSELNALIRGRIATTSLVRCVVEAMDPDRSDSRMLDALLQGLSESNVTRVDINFTEAIRTGLTVPLQIYDNILSSCPAATMEHVQLTLPHTIERFPSSRLKPLTHLHTLDLHDSTALLELPEDITECFALSSLDISGCTALIELPPKIFDLRALTTLTMSGCARIKKISARGLARSKLEVLIMEDCIGLLELPETLGVNLASLQRLQLRGCYNLVGLPPWVSHMEAAGGAVMRPYHLE